MTALHVFRRVEQRDMYKDDGYEWSLYLEDLSKEKRIRMLIVFSDYFYSEDLSKEIRIKMIAMEEKWKQMKTHRSQKTFLKGCMVLSTPPSKVTT